MFAIFGLTVRAALEALKLTMERLSHDRLREPEEAAEHQSRRRPDNWD